jgi:hypothetical protein
MISAAGKGSSCALLCERPLLCGPRGMNMRPPVAQVTPAVPVGLAAASIGLSLFLLPGGSGPLRALAVGPVADLVTGSVVAALEPSVRPAGAPSHALEPELAALAPEAGASVSHRRAAAPPADTGTPRRDIRQRFVPSHPSPPSSVPASIPTPPQAAATPRVHGKAKALGRVRAHLPPGLSQPSGSSPAHGRGHATDRQHGHAAGPPGPPDGGGNHTGHGDEHGGGGR